MGDGVDAEILPLGSIKLLKEGECRGVQGKGLSNFVIEMKQEILMTMATWQVERERVGHDGPPSHIPAEQGNRAGSSRVGWGGVGWGRAVSISIQLNFLPFAV